MDPSYGLQLLKMPDLNKQQEYTKPLLQPLSLKQQKDGIKLLKLPKQSQELKIKPINLVQIPIKPSHGNEVSLIKLPKIFNEAEKETEMPLLINLQNIPVSHHPAARKQIKLLHKPTEIHKSEMITLPLSRDEENQRRTARLINIPLKEKTDNNLEIREKSNTVIPTDRHIVHESKIFKDVMYDSDRSLEKSEKREGNERVSGKPLKRKRRRKRRQIKVEIKSGKHSSGNLMTKSPVGNVQVSKETQTSASSVKKTRKSRQKVNLMSLLEQAAFLFDSDVSDEDVDLHLLEKRSHLADKEGPSGLQHYKDETKQYRKGFASNHLESNLKSNRNEEPKSSEQLLLENFNDDRLLNTVSLMSNSELSQFLTKQAENEQAIPTKHTTSSSSVVKTDGSKSMHNVAGRPIFEKAPGKPKCSAGLAWQEVVNLSRQTSSEETSRLQRKESKGIQVMDLERNSKEQVSQTDFTFGTDVTNLLLDHQEDKIKRTESRRSSEIVPDKKKSEYPWEYIGKESFSDLASLSEDGKLQQRGVKGTTILEETEKEAVESDVIVGRNVEILKNEILKNIQDDQGSQEVQPASGVHFPADILLDMKIQEDHIEAKEKTLGSGSKLLNVMDVPSKPVAQTNEHIQDNRLIVQNEIPIDKLSEVIDIVEQHAVKENDVLNENLENSEDDLSRTLEVASMVDENSEKQEDGRDYRSQIEFESDKLDQVLADGPKDRIHNNLRNLSVQLDALGELHDHLERELKNSAMLMQTVDTLHHGFFEPDKPKKTAKPRVLMHQDHDKKRIELHNVEERASQTIRAEVKETARSEAAADLEEQLASPAVDKEPNGQNHIIEDANETLKSDVSINESENQDAEDDIVIKSSNESSNMNEESVDVSLSMSVSGIDGSNDMDDDKDQSNSEAIENADEVVTTGRHDVTNEDDEIRMRLSERYPKLSERRIEEDRQNKEREIRQKLENKRKALQDWMKKKRNERHKMYQAEINEKRQREARPFVGLKSASSASLRERGKAGKENKNIIKEELFQDRIKEANSLMNDILDTKSKAEKVEKSQRISSIPAETKKRKRKGNSTPIRKGKTLLRNSNKSVRKDARKPLSYVSGNAASRKKHLYDLREKADKKWLIDNISPSWKDSSFGNEAKDFQIVSTAEDQIMEDIVISDLETSLQKPALTSSRNRLRKFDNRFRLDLSKLSDKMTTDLYSDRSMLQRSIEGKDFVTEISMERYKRKSARLLKKSLREYSGNSVEISEYRDENPAPFDYSFMTTLEMTIGDDTKKDTKKPKNQFDVSSKKEGIDLTKSQESADGLEVVGINNAHTSSNDAKDINEILTQYGLLDDDMNQHNSSETSQLLAEANQILEASEEDEAIPLSKSGSGSVDWDQVDMILKRY